MAKAAPKVGRRRWLELEILAEEGYLDIDRVRSDPARELREVKSNTTFWEDFAALAEMGFARRVSGGIAKVARDIFGGTYFGLNYASKEHQRERAAIAAHIAECCVFNYETGAVGHGTTCLDATQAILRARMGVMVITTNIAIAELAPHESAIIVGGAFERDIWALCGDMARDGLRKELAERKPHFGLVGASGISVSDDRTDIVLYCHKPAEQEILGTICEMCPRLLVAAGGDKIAKADMEAFYHMRRRPEKSETVIVTTRPPTSANFSRRQSEVEEACRNLGAGFQLHVVEAGSEPTQD
jgi:DeoR/GlpR family transcriptional regulator of sugar metabolism